MSEQDNTPSSAEQPQNLRMAYFLTVILGIASIASWFKNDPIYSTGLTLATIGYAAVRIWGHKAIHRNVGLVALFVGMGLVLYRTFNPY